MSTVLTAAPPAAQSASKRPFVLKGVMQAPVTPLHDDFSVDYDGLAKMVDFHVRNGAPAIAWPHHKAESPNLTMAERKKGTEVLIKTVATDGVQLTVVASADHKVQAEYASNVLAMAKDAAIALVRILADRLAKTTAQLRRMAAETR